MPYSEPDEALKLGQALVQVGDSKGRLLYAISAERLEFDHPGAYTDRKACLWVLAALPAAAGVQARGAGGPAVACRYTLCSAASGAFLSAADGHLHCTTTPNTVQVFMDLDRRVVLRLADKACLQAAPSGEALAGRLPLGRERAWKLFSLREAGFPTHSLRPWPLRATLRCERSGLSGGAYLCACSDGGLAAGAQVACCSEEFVLALGEGGPLSVQSGTLVAPGTSVWAGTGTGLLSAEPHTGRVLLAGQHSCRGHERFELQLSATGQVRLLAEAPAGAGFESITARHADWSSSSSSSSSATRDSSGSTSSAPAGGNTPGPVPVVVQHGMLTTAGTAGGSGGAGKPTPFALELASGKPALLITAHGHLLSFTPPAAGTPGGGGEGRPHGVLLPASMTRGDAHDSCASNAPPSPGSAACCAWVLQHHGDSVYSLRHARSGHTMYVDDHGAPSAQPPGGPIVYPDERLLFWIEPGWAELTAPATPGSDSGSSGSRNSQEPFQSSGQRGSSGNSGSSTPGTEGLAAAATADLDGFVLPCGGGAAGAGPSSLAVAGFTIRSVRRVCGRHLYLSALPDGLLTTVNATSQPSRWELFTVADLQTVMDSPVGLLGRLPCAQPLSAQPAAGVAAAEPASLPAQAPLRRVASMQTLSSGGGGGGSGSSATSWAVQPDTTGRHGSSGAIMRGSPSSLPAVQEEGAAEAPPPPLLQLPPSGLHQPTTPQQHTSLPPPRRCHSETSLAALSQREDGQGEGEGGSWRRRRPLWLSQLLRGPQQARGWGTCSAASLQDLACRQLCASLAAEWRRQHGGKQAPAGLLEAVVTELSTHLPDELCSRIERELRLLLLPPAPTKLSLHQLSSAAAATGPKAAPAWAQPHLHAPDGPGLEWLPETFVCAACRGASGPLLPLDPYTNPSHHLFLHAMERTARGGGRVRLRARRRHDQDDLLVRALTAGKLLLLAWAAGRTLGAVLLGGGGGGSGAA